MTHDIIDPLIQAFFESSFRVRGRESADDSEYTDAQRILSALTSETISAVERQAILTRLDANPSLLECLISILQEE